MLVVGNISGSFENKHNSFESSQGMYRLLNKGKERRKGVRNGGRKTSIYKYYG